MWEQIAANRRRSTVLISVMVVILAVIGYTGGELIVPGAGPLGLGVAFIIWAVMMAMYLFGAEKLLLGGALFHELTREDSPRLFNIVEEMKLAAGLPYLPKLYLIHESAPNAFAIGRKPEDYAIAVTSGLLHRLNRDELQGVIAHEVGHLKNQDVKFMTLAAVLLGSIVILSDVVRRSLWYGGRGRRRSDSRGGGQAQVVILVVGLLFAILGPIMAQLLYLACSRKREFLADASAAQYTRYPEGLASALEKIALAGRGLSFVTKATAPMFIVNPLAAASEDSFSLLSTHPPTAERIRILRQMAGASLADYETAYRQMKQGALIGGRSLATAAPQSIRAPTDEGPIESRHAADDIAYRQHGYLRLRCECGLDIKVPERYEQKEIHCIRCGSALPIPSVLEGRAPSPPTPEPTGPLAYTRATKGWESFRCACGRTIQLSPAFAAPQVRCHHCRRLIEVS